jgi:hypothetical protein
VWSEWEERKTLSESDERSARELTDYFHYSPLSSQEPSLTRVLLAKDPNNGKFSLNDEFCKQ